MEEEYIKQIFGLKLKQIRNEKGLSLFGLSKLTGLSKSYLNEIENGKKYPKPDKIAILSERLEVPYDSMVSLKLDKNLAPIGELLRSKILKEIPLDLFGIKESTLIEIVSNAPVKVNAFISTIIEIAQHYSFSRESFYLASVRSFQQANYNYFEDLEQKVIEFVERHELDATQSAPAQVLEEILTKTYGYTIQKKGLKSSMNLGNLRTIHVPETKVLLLSEVLDESQRTFIYAKELAYNYLKIAERLYTFPWIKFDTFDQVLNNFYASYFAGALLLPKNSVVMRLSDLFSKTAFDMSLFDEILDSYNASPESFYQRLTNVLPKEFNIQNLFFLRFNYKDSTKEFLLDKELHLSHQHSPRANEINEHYCRRWVSLDVLEKIYNTDVERVSDVQISDYDSDGLRYLVFSTATKDPFKENDYRSVSVGLLINKSLQRKLKFLGDPAIKRQTVNVTCERCGIEDCNERLAPPTMLEQEQDNKRIELLVEELSEKFKNVEEVD